MYKRQLRTRWTVFHLTFVFRGACSGVQRYELDSPPESAGKFALDVGTKLDGSSEVKLRLNERVDRETQAEYRLRLRAVDGGAPTPRTGTLDVVVAVLDSNDNRPVFTDDQYELTVVENSPVRAQRCITSSLS